MTPTEKLLAEQEKIVAERGYYIRPVRMANLMKAASRIFDSGLQHIHCQWSKDGAAHQLWHDSRARHC